jgi:hypothetical protein
LKRVLNAITPTDCKLGKVHVPAIIPHNASLARPKRIAVEAYGEPPAHRVANGEVDTLFSGFSHVSAPPVIPLISPVFVSRAA